MATDAPLGSAQLTRVARRAGLGLARTGSVAHHGSGEIFVAFSTTARAPRGEPAPPTLADAELDPLFLATVDATEEAVLNALWAAETTHRPRRPRGRAPAARAGARATRPSRAAHGLNTGGASPARSGPSS